MALPYKNTLRQFDSGSIWDAGCIASSVFLYGLKVFMDAHMPVTHEEGDRYPLRPPSLVVSVSK